MSTGSDPDREGGREWTGQRPVDDYCERLGPGLWAEPLNLVTNLAFLIAAILWRRCRGGRRGRCWRRSSPSSASARRCSTPSPRPGPRSPTSPRSGSSSSPISSSPIATSSACAPPVAALATAAACCPCRVARGSVASCRRRGECGLWRGGGADPRLRLAPAPGNRATGTRLILGGLLLCLSITARALDMPLCGAGPGARISSGTA